MLTRMSVRDISQQNQRVRAGQVGGTLTTRTTTMPDSHTQTQVNHLAQLQSRFNGMKGGRRSKKSRQNRKWKRSRRSQKAPKR